MVQDWRDIASSKRAEVAKQLPQQWRLPSNILDTINEKSDISVMNVPSECGILTTKELEITGKYDAVDLIKKMEAKELSSVEVTTAFCKRAAIAHQVTNCLTEIFFDWGLERAKQLDDYLAKEGKPMGPLHGMPISIKDHINLKGTASTIGYVSFVSRGLADFNSPLVDILLNAGAVFYCKTNIPQTMMTTDSHNNLFGRTLNPNRLCLNAGGSSGGEGALIAMRGSILGVGSDVGGSIRIPPICDGAFGFKPSVHRIPFGGQTLPVKPGAFGIDPVLGPLAQSPRDIRLFLETVIKAAPWDYDCSALCAPWRATTSKKTLRIGFIPECPSAPVSPPILRALNTASEKLKAAGHSIIVIDKFPSFRETNDLSVAFFDLDNDFTGLKFATDSGEPLVPSVVDAYDIHSGKRQPKTLEQVFDHNAQRWGYRAAWHKIFTENKLDVLLAPGAHRTAAPHDTFHQANLPNQPSISVPYSVTWNLVPFPACVIPFLKADKSIDKADARMPKYDPDLVDGMPCHLQIIARNEQDEELMDAVEIIADVLKYGKP